MPTPAPSSYHLGFTAASLRPELARIVAEHFLEEGDWEAAKRRILETNALQCRSTGSAVRLERELRQRLQHLNAAQIRLLVEATGEDRAAMAWLSACKHIQIASDFAREVLRDKLALLDPVLRLSDYETFMEQKAVIHPELARLAESSSRKIRQVLLRMLTEAGLLVEGTALGLIQRPVLSPAVVSAISADNPRWLAGFLVPDLEIASY